MSLQSGFSPLIGYLFEEIDTDYLNIDIDSAPTIDSDIPSFDGSSFSIAIDPSV